MRIKLAVASWIFFQTLLLVAFLSESEACRQIFSTCCTEEKLHRARRKITRCFEQTRHCGCDVAAYLVRTGTGVWMCIDPKVLWLGNLLRERKIQCQPATIPTKVKLELLAVE